jgi:cytochrome o ubiquinol oxidase subunit 1
VHSRDPYWEYKQSDGKSGMSFAAHGGAPELPGSTPLGFVIGALAGAFGFALVWHIWWLAALSFAAVAACLIYRSFEHAYD